MYAVFRDRNSHCCIRVNDDGYIVEYIALVEEAGSLRTDVFKMEGREFYNTYKELPEYPVKRAAGHYLNPLTPAIGVSAKAEKHLKTILGKNMTEDAKTTQTTTEVPAKKARGKAEKSKVVKDESSKAVRNIEQTEQAGLKTDGKVHKTTPAPVKVIGDVKAATTKAKKGTWDKKESPTEANRDAQKKAVRNHKEEQQKAAKKAARKAASAAKKTTTNEEKSDMTTTTNGAAKKATKTAAKKATKTAAKPAAKKTVKGTGKGASAAAKKQTAAATKTAKKANKPGRAGAYDESMKITVLVKDNPKREGSAAYDIFELLKKSKTVGDFYAKGGAAHNLRWNEDREYIKVK